MGRKVMRDYAQLKSRKKAGTIETAAFRERKRHLSLKMLHEVTGYLRKVEFSDKDHCLICNKDCFISPMSDPYFADWNWVEIGGVVCTPWSQIGCHSGWLHPCTCAKDVMKRKNRHANSLLFTARNRNAQRACRLPPTSRPVPVQL